MQLESEPTPFRPTRGEPVLRLDATGKREAAQAVAASRTHRREIIYRGNEDLMIHVDQRGPNVVIDRLSPPPPNGRMCGAERNRKEPDNGR